MQCSRLLAVIDREGHESEPLEQNLYGGVAQACIGRWRAARRALDSIEAEQFTDDCLMKSTYDTLRRLVEAHESDPDAIVRISGTAAPKCQPPPDQLAGPEESPTP
jgi:hypothetical protein